MLLPYFKKILSFLIPLMFYSAYGQGFTYQTNPNSAMPPNNSIPAVNQGVTIKEHLGNKIDLNLIFTDQTGKQKTLGELTEGGKPLLLTLNYYRCTTLCGVQLMNVAKTVKELGWPIGKDYSIATISFDPTDTPADAKKKQTEYLTLANQSKGKWNFFVGNQENIDKISKEVGFYYNYIPRTKEYSHTAAIFFISPDGTITRYLYGISYKVNDVKFSLMDASKGKLGSTTDRFLLFCCNYDPNAGAYTGLAMGIMRTVGIIMMALLGLLVFFYYNKRKKLY
jgi:protein SCO1